MSNKQTGFTLIELVMVIVIIGILAAVAIPKFVDLSGEARNAAAQGVAGALASASAMNYALRKANSAKGNEVKDCKDVGGLLVTGLNGHVITTPAPIAADATATCTITNTNGATATFVVLGID